MWKHIKHYQTTYSLPKMHQNKRLTENILFVPEQMLHTCGILWLRLSNSRFLCLLSNGGSLKRADPKQGFRNEKETALQGTGSILYKMFEGNAHSASGMMPSRHKYSSKAQGIANEPHPLSSSDKLVYVAISASTPRGPQIIQNYPKLISSVVEF